MAKPFYETKSLEDMSGEEWESLCDGCGKCCVVVLEEEQTGTLWRTNVGCKLLDLKTVRCSDYASRHTKVPSCVKLSPDNIADLHWMPDTCAYRLLSEGNPLPDWHPLKTGDLDSTRNAGVGVHGTLVSETEVENDDLEDHIVE